MKLDYFYSGTSSRKVDNRIDYEGFVAAIRNPYIHTILDQVRVGDKEQKKELPCVCYMGTSQTGQRKAADMQPTGLVMIDIDHCDDPETSYRDIERKLAEAEQAGDKGMTLYLAHRTPSAHGLRLVFLNVPGIDSVEGQITHFAERLGLSAYGDVDMACKDLTRISFLVPEEDVYRLDEMMFYDHEVYVKAGARMGNSAKPLVNATAGQTASNTIDPMLYKDFKYGEIPVRDIALAYCEYYFPDGNHMPPDGTRHTFYNQMIKDFRCICDNKPEILVSVLPTFNRDYKECFDQCYSICQRNNLSKLPRPFYFFLKDKGWYVNPFGRKENELLDVDEEPEDPYQQLDQLIDAMPKLPPVFRELMNTAPRYYKIPYMMSLLPIMGTMTSYLEGRYNGQNQTTSFMTVVYAPPSSGKSYLVALSKVMLTYINNRDMISAARDDIYARTVKSKSANEKSPEDPRTPMRIMPAINSLPKVLSKMRNNQGYHMFTAVEEMDTWIKGSKRDGDKNDLYRTAWDNGEYGQSFMSAQTFNGIVKLYWNVLITGTIDQVLRYFSNIENGMITRCSICDLGDQTFTLAPRFKDLTNKDRKVIEDFKRKCDEESYVEPMNFDMNALYDVKDEDFDKTVPWRQEFRERQEVDIDWILPHIDKWGRDQALLASKAADHARDVFRRRVAVRGYRLALMCTALYPKIREREKQVIVDFVLWFMECDLYGILKLFGKRYNEHWERSTSEVQEYRFPDAFDQLNEEFTTKELLDAMKQTNITSRHYQVLSIWKKAKLIEKTGKGHYKKLTNKKETKK